MKLVWVFLFLVGFQCVVLDIGNINLRVVMIKYDF